MAGIVTAHVWGEIGEVLSSTGPRRVAVAFLGADAPALMPKLGRGDVLVCNASERALKLGATNPAALKAFLDRGVAVFSRADLHAKVYVARRSAFVGSANASVTSAGLREAGVRVDAVEDVKELKGFVEELAAGPGAVRVDDAFVQLARKLFRPSRGPGMPGPPTRSSARPIWVTEIEEYEDAPPAVGRAAARTRQGGGFEVGENAGTVDWNWFEDGSWRRGDQALFVYESGGELCVDPPARCVLVEKVSPRSRYQVAWWEYPVPVTGYWEELVEHLLQHGHRLSPDKPVRSSEAQRLIADWFGIDKEAE